MTLGDLHNFGQAVRCETTPDGNTWFKKPRTVFWEHLFFGVTSPLRCFFSRPEILFGQIVEPTYPSSVGRCLEVKSQNSTIPNGHYAFGYLLGYAYLFGIQDLFCENLIRTSKNIQPIDAEIVLSKFFLPHESSLIPFKTTPFEKSGLSLLEPNPSLITTTSVREIIDGFVEVLSEATSKAVHILEQIEREVGSSQIPIRILLRPTSEYRNWQESAAKYLPEEIEQMSRGDIPYFFKFIGDDSVYFYQRNDAAIAIKSTPQDLIEPLKNLAVHPSELIRENRIQDFLLPNGCLYLLKHLVPHSFTEDISSEQFRARFTNQSIELEIFGRSFSARRK